MLLLLNCQVSCFCIYNTLHRSLVTSSTLKQVLHLILCSMGSTEDVGMTVLLMTMTSAN